MTQTFPLTPVPATYGQATWNIASRPRNAIFTAGGTAPIVTLSKAGSTSYQVRDFFGNIVSSGTCSAAATTITPTAPGGGWRLGWYRFNSYGPVNDAVFGTSYCATCFCIVADDSRFVPVPAGNVDTAVVNTYNDPVMRGLLAVGPSRYGVSGNPRFPTLGQWNRSHVLTSAALSAKYWSNPGAQYLDPNRPRIEFLQFPGLLDPYNAAGVDGLLLPANSGTYVTAYCKDGTVDAAQTYVSIAAGSVSGAKIRVYHGTSATLAETYDNLASSAAAQTAINGVSSYIRVYNPSLTGSGKTTPGTLGATAIGRAMLPKDQVGLGYIDYWALDGTDAANVYVSIGAGSVSGAKVTVYHNGTAGGNIVETYDNLASNVAAVAAISGVSAYIGAWGNAYGTFASTQALAATACSNTAYNSSAAWVAACYAVGITVFEGPENEPAICAEAALKLKLFSAAVKAGNASAKAMGPGVVQVGDLTHWGQFFDELTALSFTPDYFSTHAYDAFSAGGDNAGTDMNCGRATLTPFFNLVSAKGFGAVPWFQTESTQSMPAQYGVHRPRVARASILQTLVFEEYGVPREHNPDWYDTSQGFWNYPSFEELEDWSVEPHPVLYRTLAAETWGQTYRSRVTFPGLADSIFAAWLYDDGATNKTCVFLSTSYMAGSTITFATDATGPLTLVDSWGNTSSVTVSGGRFTVSPTEIPQYVRLPYGKTCTAYTVNGWTQPQNSDIALGQTCTVDAVAASVVTAGTFAAGTYFKAAGSLPSTVKIVFNQRPINVPTIDVERVLIWCGNVWQTFSTLMTFTIATSTDGITWTTRATFDNSSSYVSFLAGVDSKNTGTQRESYAPDQWIFDVSLGGSITLAQLRVSVTAATFGGLPDQAALDVRNGGDNPHVVLQRIACVGTVTPGAAGHLTAKTYGTH
jgi:hypothetical protein